MNYFMLTNSLILIILFLPIISSQYPCLCSCCLGENCQLTSIGNVYASSCSSDSCRTTCREKYSQCSADIPYGQSTGQCLSATTITPINGSFVCRCDCCNTGSATCSPILIGYSTAFSCSSASCSVSCSSTYPLVCISNENGQTQGTCQGLTTTTTTVSSWLGYPCSCYCCQSNSYCNPTIFVGNTSSTLCSTYTCSSACQQQYSSLCPLSTSIGQTLGQCLTISNGSIRCQCTCCGSIACLDYDIYTNSDCTTCPLMCSLYTKCANTYQTTYLCYTNSTYRQQFSILFLIFIIFNDYTTFI